ncbi:MAG: carbohydrate-binding domain-containing protein, partial [Firmicutes bacterium]|nr:carbohydrate-binding domain-containing protein [Bacillota bacterium]
METEVKNMNAEDSGKKKKRKIAAIVAAVLILAAIPAGVYAYRAANGLGGPFAGIIGDKTAEGTEETETRGPRDFRGEDMTPPEGEPPEGFGGERPEGGPGQNGHMGPGQGGQNGPMGQNGQAAGTSAEPLEIKTSSLTENSAEALSADMANAQTIVMSEENSKVKIDAAGTYIVTGSCADGSITVKKGTTGVVLILRDLDLTSSSSATLSLNKGTETRVIVEGTVKLTDAEDIANEDSDDFDGAVIKAKAGSSSVLTGTGTLYVNGVCKHGIKVSDLEEDDIADGYSEASFIVDGATIIIDAADDGMNSGTDLTIKSGNITVRAEDDGIKADYILTIGEEGTAGPTINVEKAGEAIEGAVINIYSGD